AITITKTFEFIHAEYTHSQDNIVFAVMIVGDVTLNLHGHPYPGNVFVALKTVMQELVVQNPLGLKNRCRRKSVCNGCNSPLANEVIEKIIVKAAICRLS